MGFDRWDVDRILDENGNNTENSPIIFQSNPIQIDEARRQHAGVVNAVRSLGLDVLELPPDESNFASVFTQDLAVVINGKWNGA